MMNPKWTITLLTLFAFTSTINAHFQLLEPAPRGYNEDTLATYPCGGQNSVSTNRSMFSLNGGAASPIQLNLEHARSAIQVNLAVGNDAVDGSAFNVTVLPIIQEQGIGSFCLAGLSFPASLNLKEGQNASLQVITNGDPSGGLYNCADITFTTSTPSSSEALSCTNGTRVTSSAFKGSNKDANMTSAATEESAASTLSLKSDMGMLGSMIGVGLAVVGVVGLLV